LEEKMLVSVSIVILASHLAVAVADDFPKFDTAWGCRIDNAAFDTDTRTGATEKGCIADEQGAKSALKEKWSSFTGPDRIDCTALTIENGGNPPSYVELHTCLQEKQSVRTSLQK
jgi:hypothetical protein